jgi:hypothetical protein
MKKLPDFIIIGAMKSATSTLYEQLVSQPGIFMTVPKEPNFFSDDEQYKKGLDWYQSLYSDAGESELVGEASTHYTKLPTYPKTIERLLRAGVEPRIIYVMRHPIDRLISHYIHEWTQGVIRTNIEEAIIKFPELQTYSLYSMQLKPFIEAFGKDAILPISFDHLKNYPQQELEHICQFIGYAGKPKWKAELKPSNVSRDRNRKIPLNYLLLESSLATWLRRNLVPKGFRNLIKKKLSMTERPVISENTQQKLKSYFDKDLSVLGGWFGIELNCNNFTEVTKDTRLEWVKD